MTISSKQEYLQVRIFSLIFIMPILSLDGCIVLFLNITLERVGKLYLVVSLNSL